MIRSRFLFPAIIRLLRTHHGEMDLSKRLGGPATPEQSMATGIVKTEGTAIGGIQ
jgi:hypothetical protein